MEGAFHLRHLALGTDYQRFEAKYTMGEPEAHMIRAFIRPFVKPDKHMGGGTEYPVNSLYLDSPSLRLYWSSVYGEKNRFKLRIRDYGAGANAPVFFEIKRRIDQAIQKQRAAVPKIAIAPFLSGRGFSGRLPTRLGEHAQHALHEFRRLQESLNARPWTCVQYFREAYVSSLQEPVRLTFDRRLSYLPVRKYQSHIWDYDNRYAPARSPEVVMEVKFTDAYPKWLEELIQRFNLVRVSLAKYVACVDSVKNKGLNISLEEQ